MRRDAMDKAIASAQAGVAKYPSAVIARLCLANAYQQNKMWDSVLSVTEAIRKFDSQSKLVNTFAIEAFKQKAGHRRTSSCTMRLTDGTSVSIGALDRTSSARLRGIDGSALASLGNTSGR